jgi:hypothetical protein
VHQAGVHHGCISAAIVLDMEMAFDVVGLGEDVGSSVTRHILNAPSSQNTTEMALSHDHGHSVPESDSIIISDDPLRFATTVNDESLQPTVPGVAPIGWRFLLLLTPTTDRLDVERRLIQKRSVKVNKLSKHSRTAEGTHPIPAEERAKKMMRDEIDDIFGF